MKKYSYCILAVFLLTLCCCQGVRFASAPVNLPLPIELQNRALYPSGVAGYEFQDLVGNVLIITDENNPRRAEIIVPSGYSPEVIPICEPNNYYRSRIQRGAEVYGSYLSFAAKMGMDDLKEITISDVARACIQLNADYWEEITQQLSEWVVMNPRQQLERRVWVKAVVLSRQEIRDCVKISADSNGQVGDVIGVKTGVYNKSEQGTKSVAIAFEAFDIDLMLERCPGGVLGAGETSIESFESILEYSRYIGVINGNIE